MVPFNLFHDCIENLFPKLKRWSPSGHVADCPHEYEIIESVQATVVKNPQALAPAFEELNCR